MAPSKENKKTNKESTPTNMEDSVIILPMLNDSVVGLGDLWDCRANLSPGNIFGSPFKTEHLEYFPMQSLEYELYKSQNTGDKMNSLKVSANMSLDLVLSNGKLKIEGSAAYDAKDIKTFNEEELICTYKASTFVVRTRPTAFELIDPLIKTKLIDGTIKATHYVQSVRLGGEASGSVKYSKLIEDKNMNIKGSFQLDLVVGSVTIKAKAEMEMLDKEYEAQYKTTVNVKASPRFKKSPVSVEDMFKQIDEIDQNLNNEKHFPVLGEHIVGIPLTFKLVPLGQLFDYKVEALYKLLADDVMNDFTSMVFTCNDFEKPNFIKGLIREGDSRLVTILKDEINPYTKKVTTLEIEYNKISKEIKEEAFNIFTLYKDGEKNATDIQQVVRNYDIKFNIIELYATIQKLVEEGKKELTGIHASDVVDLNGEILFFSNNIDLTDWWGAERTIKLLLQTNFSTASPSGTFLRLFNLCGPLGKLGVEIGIAFPNISKDFSLTFKIRDKEVVYKNSDIVFALEVLGIAIENGETMSSLFFTLNGLLSGLNMTSVSDNLPDITSLVSIFKESRGVNICESYAQLLETLGKTTNTWNFVIPLQGVNCSIEMMKFFRQLREILPEQYPKLIHQWIIGKFNVDEYDSPLLFVFHDNELKAICLDHLDILILLNQFKISSTTPDLSLLGYENLKKECFYPNRANFAIKILEGLILDHSTSLIDLVPNLQYFTPNIPKQLTIAISVTRTSAMRNELHFLNNIATICIEDYSELSVKLNEYGWTDDGFSTVEKEIKFWKELQSMLEDFLGNQAPYLIKVDGAIKALRQLKVPEDEKPEEITKLKNKIKEIIKFITPDFGSTTPTTSDIEIFTPRIKNYEFRGIIINEDDKYKKLKPIIESFEDSEITNMLRGILNSFENFYNDELDDENNNFFNLVQFILLVEKLASEEQTFKPILIEITKKYCIRALNSIDKNNFPDAEKKINDAFYEKNLFKALGYLSSFTQNYLMYNFTQEIYNLKTLNNIEPIRLMIENMTTLKFTDDQLKTIWTNPKFLFLIRYGIDNPALVKTIYIQLCIGNQQIPRFIPNDIAEKIKPLFFTMDEPKFDWITKWNDITTVIQVLQILVTRKYIPSLFPRTLREHIVNNKDIKQSFHDSGALFYWNNTQSYFDHPWSIKTIENALKLLLEIPLPKFESKSLDQLLLQKLKPPSPTIEVKAVEPPPPSVVTTVPPTSTTTTKSMSPKPGYIQLSRQSSVLDLEQLDSTKELPVADNWKKFTMNGYFDKMIGSEFNNIKILRKKPLVEYDELRKTFDEILPYLVQQAKMNNFTSIQPNHVVGLIKYPPTDGTPRPGYIDFEVGNKKIDNSIDKFLMSKNDLITALLNCSDPLICHYLLYSMMNIPMALPLIIPGIHSSTSTPGIHNSNSTSTSNNGFKFILPALQNLIVHELEDIVPHPHLLTKPFRLIFTIRIGDVSGKLGKSTMLNHMLMSNHNLFSCYVEPGVSNGKPISRPGYVEFIWLSRSKINEEFYENVIKQYYEDSNEPDMILLGNLHGDAMNSIPILELLKTFTSSFIVFWKANNWNDLKSKKIELNKIIGNGSSILDLIIYPDSTIIEHVHQQNIISMSTPEETIGSKLKLYNIFKEAISSKPKIPTSSSSVLKTNTKHSSSGGTIVQQQDDLLTYSDPGILGFIRQCKPNGGSLSIQFKISEFEDDNISCPESHQLIQFIRYHTIQKIKEMLILNKNKNENENKKILEKFIELFFSVLGLPIIQRNMALTHFNYELDYQSRKSSKLVIERLLKLRIELESYEKQLDEEEIIELQNDIKAILIKLEITTLSIQDIFRYIINKYNSSQEIHEKYYDYINSGFAIELFQPSHSNVMWDEPLAKAIQNIPQDTRIFVISIVGLKAGGKSTLLNHLFGSGFREGPGGCTYGLHMRFLWVNENLRKDLKCDGFCIIDSEGFGAPENFIDEHADLNERDMSSFILGISHLTIANILGKQMNELQDILEISCTTLTRINDMILTPDILLVQQQLQQQSNNPTHDDDDDDDEFIIEWNQLMKNVKTLTRENEMELGIRVREAYRMETIKQRLKHDELIHIIRPISNQPEINSTEYHVDIQSLYSKIITMCQNSTQIIKLGDWYKYTKQYWESIKEIPIPNIYKNTIETKGAITLNQKIRNVKRAIDLAFRNHDKSIDDKFTTDLDKHLPIKEDGISVPEIDSDDKLLDILDQVYKSLDEVINACRGIDKDKDTDMDMDMDEEINITACTECLSAFTLREALFSETHDLKKQFRTVDTINDYMAEVYESLWGKYKQRIIARQIQTGIIKDNKKDELHLVWENIKKTSSEEEEIAWTKYKQFVSTLQTMIHSGHRIDAEAEDEYAILPHILNRLSDKHPLPDLENIIAFDLGHYNNALESAVNLKKRETLTWDKNDWLIARIEDLPAMLLTDSGVDIYLVGMTRELHDKINEILETFQTICGEQLQPNFKWETHLYAIKVFKAFMEKKHAKWNETNNPLFVLEKRKEDGEDFDNLFEEQ